MNYCQNSVVSFMQSFESLDLFQHNQEQFKPCFPLLAVIFLEKVLLKQDMLSVEGVSFLAGALSLYL